MTESIKDVNKVLEGNTRRRVLAGTAVGLLSGCTGFSGLSSKIKKTTPQNTTNGANSTVDDPDTVYEETGTGDIFRELATFLPDTDQIEGWPEQNGYIRCGHIPSIKNHLPEDKGYRGLGIEEAFMLVNYDPGLTVYSLDVNYEKAKETLLADETVKSTREVGDFTIYKKENPIFALSEEFAIVYHDINLLEQLLNMRDSTPGSNSFEEAAIEAAGGHIYEIVGKSVFQGFYIYEADKGESFEFEADAARTYYDGDTIYAEKLRENNGSFQQFGTKEWPIGIQSSYFQRAAYDQATE